LWQHAVALGTQHPDSETLALFIDSLNRVIDLHETRMTVARYRMPPSVTMVLYVVAFAAIMVVGVYGGLSGGRSLLVTSLLAAMLSMVMLLIIDVDRPSQALFSVSQQSLINLRDSMDNRTPLPP
jgi:hypothetical protein